MSEKMAKQDEGTPIEGKPRPRRRVGPRPVLSRERVLEAALALADTEGLEALSMRRLGQALGVEAMSLYHHVAHKDDLLDGLVDQVMAEIAVPPAHLPWKAALRHRALSAHAALLRHPWAPALIESRLTPSPVKLAHHNAVIGALRRGGFTIAQAYRAFLTLDSYLYGFTLQEVTWPFELDERPAVAEALVPVVDPATYPHLVEMMGFVMGGRAAGAESAEHAAGAEVAERAYSAYASEFAWGLDLILDGLERALAPG